MKSMKKLFFIAAIAMTCTVLDAGAQVVIRVRPARPVIVRTVAPSPRHVWVEEDWRPVGDHYEWHGGYWVAPPHPGWVWRPGHWRAAPGGEVWVPGHWRRR